MKWRKYNWLICAGITVLYSMEVSAQTVTAADLDALDVSYVYAAVMGTGTYKIEERRISMLRLPFAFTQRKMTEDQAGLKWYVPVVLGYDALNYDDWLSRLIDDNLVTLTVLPGFEYQQPLGETWVLKPYANLGAGYDFTRSETILMGVLGLRTLATWIYEDRSEFRFGAGGRWAAEYQIHSYDRYSFGMLDSGVDYRRDTHFRFLKKATNAGIYYRAQLFLPDWNIDRDADGHEATLRLVHEIGGSIGFQKPPKFLGFTISRVRVGYKFGDNVRGWTIGTEFPF